MMKDSVLVNIVDPPSIDLRYPPGGGKLDGTVGSSLAVF
jgi:hypothetical protein